MITMFLWLEYFSAATSPLRPHKKRPLKRITWFQINMMLFKETCSFYLSLVNGSQWPAFQKTDADDLLDRLRAWLGQLETGGGREFPSPYPNKNIRRALKRSTVKREWLKKIKKTWKSLGVTANSVALISAQLKTEPFLLIFLKPRFVFLENVDADIETGSRLSFAILFLGPASSLLLFYFWARRGELARLAGRGFLLLFYF